MINWIPEQSLKGSEAFDLAMAKYYPEATQYTSDPEKYFERVCLECNYLEAVNKIDWKSLLPENARVMDLAGGTGWLAAFLSSLKYVSSVIIVDQSSQYLEINLPVAIKRLAGISAKVTPINGLFYPLLLADNSLDAVFVSSSLHHADNLEKVLTEINRILVPGGWCFILNETPFGYLEYIRLVLSQIKTVLVSAVKKQYLPVSMSISQTGVLVDQLLGDWCHPNWYWQQAIKRSGFAIRKTINTGLSTVKGKKGRALIHYFCQKVENKLG